MFNLKNFQSIFKASPVPSLILLPDSPDFTVIEGNDAFIMVSAFDKENLLNKPIAEAFPEIKVLPDFRSSLKEVIIGKESRKLDPVKRAGENTIAETVEFTPILDEKADVEYILCTLNTNGKSSPEAGEASIEYKLNIAQEHYRSLFDHNPNAVFSLDLEGNFLTANKSTARLLECAVEDILNRSFSPFICPEDADRVQMYYKKASGGDPQNYDISVTTAKGNKLDFNITNLPIIVKEEIVGVYGVARDITEKTKAEQLIRKREEQLRKIMDRSLDVICTIDEEGKFLKVGAASLKLWGYTPEELEGTKVLDLLHKDDLDATRQEAADIFREAEVTNLKNRIIRKDGLSRVNIWSGRWDEEDKILYAVARDYSEMHAAEEKVKNNEKRFKALLTNSTDGLFLLSEDGTVIEGSLTGSKILGLKENEIIGKKWSQFILPEDAEVVKEAFLKALVTPEEADITEHRIVTGDGKTKWLESTFHNQLNEAVVSAVVLTFWDVTEKKTAELAIKESERVRKLIMDSSLDSIVCTNLEGIVTLWNSQAEKTFGWRKEEIIGKPMADYIIPPKLRERHNTGMARYLQSGRGRIINQVVEITALNKQQQEFPVELTVTHIKEPGTNFLCAFIKDISERKEVENSLRRSEERYHKMVEEVKDYAIILLDKNGCIENWNKGAENIKGYEEEEVLGKHFKLFYPEEDKIKKVPEELLQRAEEDGIASIEGWRVRKDGSLFWANVTLTALYGDDQSIIGFTKVTRDLTEKKRAEEELIKNAEELKASNEDLEQFAYVASHDLQEPLRMVTSFLTQLERKYNEVLDAKGKQYIHYAVDGAVRMRKIILDLLEYSRVGRMEHQVEAVDMNTLVSEVVDLNRTVIEEKSAVIEWEDLPVIRGRKPPLLQVLHNLIGNALKYQDDDKEPRVKITATDTPQSWQFAIADNGIGIEPQFSDKIFTIFQRLHNKTEYSGNGIGLAICKKIIENHKGKIWVGPNSENGSTFYFTISKQIK